MAVALPPPAVARVEALLAGDRDRMPVADALARRLGVASWTLTLDATGRLRAVTLLAPSALALTEVDAPPPPANPIDRSFPLPPGGRLAALLDGPTATGRQLVDLAIRQEDPALRAETIGVAVDAMLRDPALETELLGSLDRLDDDALARALAGLTGDDAVGIATLVAERARGRPLGRRAAGVLARLPRP
jgi:hypothetical protein